MFTVLKGLAILSFLFATISAFVIQSKCGSAARKSKKNAAIMNYVGIALFAICMGLLWTNVLDSMGHAASICLMWPVLSIYMFTRDAEVTVAPADDPDDPPVVLKADPETNEVAAVCTLSPTLISLKMAAITAMVYVALYQIAAWFEAHQGSTDMAGYYYY